MSDNISRADAIEAVVAEGRKVYTSEYANAERIVYEADAVEALSMLPSADTVHKPDYSYEADMVRRLKESQKGSYTGFCKSQLITCNFVKACNGVCPYQPKPSGFHVVRGCQKQVILFLRRILMEK